MFDIGRLCIKLAGRDARKKCVVLEKIDDTYVLVDGQTRRKKVNIKHLEPLDKVIKIKEKASHSDVMKAFEKEGIGVEEKKPKKKKSKKKTTEKKEEKKEDKPKKTKKKSSSKKKSKSKKSKKKTKKKSSTKSKKKSKKSKKKD